MKKRKSSLQRIFPDNNEAAYYNPLSQIVNISKYTLKDFSDMDLSTPNSDSIDKFALLEHELTHWVDHVATLWGQKSLVLIYNALNARANEDIDEFWRIKSLFSNFNMDDYYYYYTEDYGRSMDPAKKPWRYQVSSGIRFSSLGHPEYDKPILFMRFNCFNDIPLIRIPVSVASILEINAIYSEFQLKLTVAHQIEDVIQRTLKIKEIQNEWLSILYDQELALYTSVAHLTANLNAQTDAVEAYKVASAIGTTVLNIPDELYDKLTLTKFNNAEWDKRMADAIGIKEKGFTFYNLLKNLIDIKGCNSYSIENVLECSNLPSKQEMEDLIQAEMNDNLALLIEGPFKNKAIETIKKGIEIFKLRGIDGNKSDFRSKIVKEGYLPHVMFGDTVFDETKFNLEHALKNYSSGQDPKINEVYFTCDYYDRKMNEFVNACGV